MIKNEKPIQSHWGSATKTNSEAPEAKQHEEAKGTNVRGLSI
jgi:hypothetical protein